MDNLTPELILAISGLITGLLAAIGSYISSKKSARKDEVVLLREEVERLQKSKTVVDGECDKWRTEFNTIFIEVMRLKNENLWLKSVLAKNGIDIPPLPENLIVKE